MQIISAPGLQCSLTLLTAWSPFQPKQFHNFMNHVGKARPSQHISLGQCVRDYLGTQVLPQDQNTSRLETTLSQTDIHYPAASTFLPLPCATVHPVWKSTAHPESFLENSRSAGGSPSSANTPSLAAKLGLSPCTRDQRGTWVGSGNHICTWTSVLPHLVINLELEPGSISGRYLCRNLGYAENSSATHT